MPSCIGHLAQHEVPARFLINTLAMGLEQSISYGGRRFGESSCLQSSSFSCVVDLCSHMMMIYIYIYINQGSRSEDSALGQVGGDVLRTGFLSVKAPVAYPAGVLQTWAH